MRQTLLRLVVLVVAIVVTAPAVEAQDRDERILRFHSDITVDPDGTMEVRETIRVRAAGDEIRRGIYRDFPTRYRDRYGNRVVVTFDVVGVLRDGSPEPWFTEGLDNGVRVYFGSESVFLDPGVYTYALTYRTSRQLGFFDEHDELYWNVTGNGWGFPVDDASATIRLPGAIDPATVETIGFTGPEGSTEQDYEATVTAGPTVAVRATRALDPFEGLTVAVAWPKGFVREPTGGERFGYFVSDNRSTIVAAIGLLVVFAYYLVTWARVGRDPEGGVIVPLYEPPAGLSPAATRYLTKMGWDDRVLSASLISMAVKGFLTITQNDGSFTLKREGAYRELSPEEKIVADKLFSKGDTIALTRSNRTRVKAALDGLKARLKTTLQKVYFFTNRRYLVPGIVLSVLAVAGVALTPTGPEKFGALFICVWLAFWSLGVGVLLFATWNAWKAGLAGGIGSKAAALFMTAFSVPFVLGELAGAYILVEMTSIGVLIALISIIALNVVFHYLLKAPTRAGRDLLDEIEGFKMYLAAVEEHRWNVLHPPDRTPGTFEKFLPYALALDVEQEWSEQFADVLSDASREGDTGYRPTWYSGRSWDVGRAATFASRVGDAMSVAVATSSSRPSGSSSGFSGGSSGGGGGGGGGGGW